MRLRSRSRQPGRVRGPSLFNSVLDQGRRVNLRHFLLGTTSETLAELTSKIGSLYPGAVVAGSYAPKFGPVDKDFIDSCRGEILKSNADIVWVALGTPKQDFAAHELAKEIQLTFLGVGAAFDFLAGTTREAPSWMQRSGTEWIYRFASEPKRLWRRYLIGNMQFMRAAAFPPAIESTRDNHDKST